MSSKYKNCTLVIFFITTIIYNNSQKNRKGVNLCRLRASVLFYTHKCCFYRIIQFTIDIKLKNTLHGCYKYLVKKEQLLND